MNGGEAVTVILLVDSDESALATIRDPLEAAGYLCASANSFTEARTRLSELSPDLLIAAIRLGAFNGLHLALQRYLDGRPSVVTDIIDDPALRREAALMNTPYVAPTVHPEELLRIVSTTLARGHGDERRRWQRAGVQRPVAATLDGMRAGVVDASYGGCQLAATEPTEQLPNQITLSIDASALIVRGRLMWRSPTTDRRLGLALTERGVAAVSAWRRWVNQVAA